MRCPDCHKSIKQGISSCPYCGAAISAVTPGEPDGNIFSMTFSTALRASIISSVLTLIVFYIFGLICGGILGTLGEYVETAFDYAFSHVQVFLFVAVIVGLAGNLFIQKLGSPAIYYVFWGVLCVVMTVIIEVFPISQKAVAAGSYGGYLMLIVPAVRVLGFSFGIGAPLTQAAIFMCYSEGRSLVKSSGLALILAVVYLVSALLLTLIGTINLQMGVTGVFLSALSGIAVFVISIFVNRRGS